MRIDKFLTKNNGVMLLLSFCLILLSSMGLSKLEFKTGYRDFIGESEYLEFSDWLSERQGESKEILFAVFKPSDGLFQTHNLVKYTQLAQSLSEIDGIASTKSWFENEKLIIGSDGQVFYGSLLLGHDIFSEAGLSRLEEESRTLVNINRRFISKDGTAASIILFLDDKVSLSGNNAALNNVRDQVQQLSLQIIDPATDDFFVTGSIFFEDQASTILRKDLRRIIPIAILLTVLLIYFIYRSFSFVILSLLMILAPLIATLGISGHIGIPLSNLSVSALLLIATLAVADILHVTSTYFLLVSSGVKQSVAVQRSISKNIRFITATTVTTAVGQLALLLSPAGPIKTMAQLVIIGVFITLILTLLMLPAVLSRITVNPKNLTGALSEALKECVKFSCRNSKFISIGSISAFIIAVIGVMDSRIQDSLTDWFSEDTEFNQQFGFVGNNFLGPDSISIAIEAETDDILGARKYPLENEASLFYKALQNDLEQTNGSGWWYTPITSAQSSKVLLNTDGSTLRLTKKDAGGLKKFSTEAAARSGLFTKFTPGKIDYSLWHFDPDSSSSFEHLVMAKDIETSIGESVGNRDFSIGGIGLALSDLSVKNFYALLAGSLETYLFITIILIIVFRSVKYGLLSLIPNTIPLVVAFGIWGFVYSEINLAAITVFSVALGIVVDDTIYVIGKFRANLKLSNSVEEALVSGIGDCGPGILATTLVLLSGFSLLATSDFLLTAEKAELAILAIGSAFVFDLFLFPAMIVELSKKGWRFS